MKADEVARTKTAIQSFGVRMDEAEGTGRLGGAGPAEGRVLLLGGSAASVPVRSAFVADSPYRVARDNGGWILICRDDVVASIEIPPEPSFYRMTTDNGLPYRKVALLHGTDCLASTVIQGCAFRRGQGGCRFCGIGLSLVQGLTTAEKSPEDLAEVAARAAREGRASHVVLTSGSTKDGEREVDLYAECARAIKEASALPIHVQVLPPRDPAMLGRLRAAGVDTVGIHIESFDEGALRRSAPHKASLGLERFSRAWREAVGIFGTNQVSSFILAGIGESDASIIEGGEMLAGMGVYPFLVPLRPIPGTPMGGERPPGPDRMVRLYTCLAQAVRSAGLAAGRSAAGCVRCGACSALPEHEAALSAGVTCRVAANTRDLRHCFEIRRRVFVEEMKFFDGTDRDENEGRAMHIIGECDGEAVGTVRVHEEGDGVWRGSRLAALPGYKRRLGRPLVEEAVEVVRSQGAKSFYAYIEAGRVPFFEACGWTTLREGPSLCGRPHTIMSVNLGLAKKSPGERVRDSHRDSYADCVDVDRKFLFSRKAAKNVKER